MHPPPHPTPKNPLAYTQIEHAILQSAAAISNPTTTVGVRAAVVVARDDLPPGGRGRGLVGYLLVDGEEGCENSSCSTTTAAALLQSIREALVRRLPSYMVCPYIKPFLFLSI